MLRRNLDVALKRGDEAGATELLAKLREAEPLSPDTRGCELEVLLRFGRPEDARRLADRLAASFPGSGRVLHLCGRAAYKVRDYMQSAAWFTESDRLETRWTTRWWLGRALTQLGRFDEAEALLSSLVDEFPLVGRDLAWLYERKGEIDRALRLIDAYLARWPDDQRALAKKRSLRAQAMDSSELRDEVEALTELGAPVREELLPEYVEALLRDGEGERARAVIRERRATLSVGARLDIAWKAYHLQAFDVATELFVEALPLRSGDQKFLGSLERAAHACGKEDEVAEAMRAHAPQAPHLYGLAIRLLSRRATPA